MKQKTLTKQYNIAIFDDGTAELSAQRMSVTAKDLEFIETLLSALERFYPLANPIDVGATSEYDTFFDRR